MWFCLWQLTSDTWNYIYLYIFLFLCFLSCSRYMCQYSQTLRHAVSPIWEFLLRGNGLPWNGFFLSYGKAYFSMIFLQQKIKLFVCIHNCHMEVLQSLVYLIYFLTCLKPPLNLASKYFFLIGCVFESSFNSFQNIDHVL